MDQKRTWIYCRVAHNGPDSEQALEGQRRMLETYARKYGFAVAGISSDMESGLTFMRPGLQEFYRAAEDGEVDILLLCSITQLGRDTGKIVEYMRLLRDLGVSVHTADWGTVDSSFDNVFLGLISEMKKRSR